MSDFEVKLTSELQLIHSNGYKLGFEVCTAKIKIMLCELKCILIEDAHIKIIDTLLIQVDKIKENGLR